MSDTPPPDVRRLGVVLWDGLPTTCPGCGAAVDQAAGCRSPEPTCRYCGQPLPCTPSPDRLADLSGGTRVVIELRLGTKAEGARGAMLFSDCHVTCAFEGHERKGTLVFDPPSSMVQPGETVSCTLELQTTDPVEAGQPFIVTGAGAPIGWARVVLVL